MKLSTSYHKMIVMLQNSGYHLIYILIFMYASRMKQDRLQCTYNIILRRILATIVAVEKQ